MATKVFLVWSMPHGDFYCLIGIFSSREKAEEAKNKWIENDRSYRHSSAYEPEILELEVDTYLSKD